MVDTQAWGGGDDPIVPSCLCPHRCDPWAILEQITHQKRDELQKHLDDTVKKQQLQGKPEIITTMVAGPMQTNPGKQLAGASRKDERDVSMKQLGPKNIRRLMKLTKCEIHLYRQTDLTSNFRWTYTQTILPCDYNGCSDTPIIRLTMVMGELILLKDITRCPEHRDDYCRMGNGTNMEKNADTATKSGMNQRQQETPNRLQTPRPLSTPVNRTQTLATPRSQSADDACMIAAQQHWNNTTHPGTVERPRNFTQSHRRPSSVRQRSPHTSDWTDERRNSRESLSIVSESARGTADGGVTKVNLICQLTQSIQNMQREGTTITTRALLKSLKDDYEVERCDLRALFATNITLGRWIKMIQDGEPNLMQYVMNPFQQLGRPRDTTSRCSIKNQGSIISIDTRIGPSQQGRGVVRVDPFETKTDAATNVIASSEPNGNHKNAEQGSPIQPRKLEFEDAEYNQEQQQQLTDNTAHRMGKTLDHPPENDMRNTEERVMTPENCEGAHTTAPKVEDMLGAAVQVHTTHNHTIKHK